MVACYDSGVSDRVTPLHLYRVRQNICNDPLEFYQFVWLDRLRRNIWFDTMLWNTLWNT